MFLKLNFAHGVTGPENAWANGKFDPKKYFASELGQATNELRYIYNQHKFEQMHPDVIRYWEAHGVKKEVFDEDKEAEEMMYSVLTPLHPEEGKLYPLVYCLHGGGENIFSAEVYGYAHLTGQGQCITVCPTASTHGNPMVESEFLRILQFLKDREYPVDFSRVYAVGFSGGEGATQRLAMMFPKMIAGIGPTPGPNSFRGVSLPILQAEYQEKYGYDMPIICVGGNLDGGDMWPLNTEQCISSYNFYMQNVAKLHNFKPLTLEESYEICRNDEDAVQRTFGLRFDATWVQPVYDTYVNFGESYNDAGVPMARFACFLGMPHTQCPMQAAYIWCYLSQFSRNTETGELIFTKRAVGGANK